MGSRARIGAAPAAIVSCPTRAWTCSSICLACGAASWRTTTRYGPVAREVNCRTTRDGLAHLRDAVITLAEAEGLPLHAQTIRERFRE